jgi:predicted alpha/beta hydrolase family esterase
MDADHLIEAGADSNYMLHSEVATISAKLADLLDPNVNRPQAMANFMEWYWNRAHTVGSAWLDNRLVIAEAMTYDLARDETALLAFDDALAGYVFRYIVNETGHHVTYLAPTDYIEPTQGAPAGARGARAMMSSVTAGQTYFVYVNGINNTDQHSVGSTGLLRDLIEDYASSFANSTVDRFYNRTKSAQIADYKATFRTACTDVGSYGAVHGLMVLGNELRKMVIAGRCVLSTPQRMIGTATRWMLEGDLLESLQQLAALEERSVSWAPEDMKSLVASLTRYYHANEGKAIFVAHSQGNLITAQALNQLQVNESYNLQQGHCTAVVGIAPPIEQSEYTISASTHVRSATYRRDILTQLAFTRTANIPRISSERSRALNDSLDAMPSSPIRDIKSLIYGYELHGANANYFASEGRDSVRTRLVAMYNQCQ